MEQSWGLNFRPSTCNEARSMGKIQDLQSNCPSRIWLCDCTDGSTSEPQSSDLQQGSIMIILGL